MHCIFPFYNCEIGRMIKLTKKQLKNEIGNWQIKMTNYSKRLTAAKALKHPWLKVKLIQIKFN